MSLTEINDDLADVFGLTKLSPLFLYRRFDDALTATQSLHTIAEWRGAPLPPYSEAAKDSGRILVVDDHEDNVELLRARLESWGFTVDAAFDGPEALLTVQRKPPDLILLDITLPGIDGFEVARRIKEDDKLPFTPIIIQTALDAIEAKVEALEAGADDYITKPIEFAELRARVRSALRTKRLHEGLEHLTRTDPLTGLANRRSIDEHLESLCSATSRLRAPYACIMCDLDHFKHVNDEYGHPAGDTVLKQFAAILAMYSREIDVAGRYGGEEFILLLQGSVGDTAVTLAERIRSEVESHSFVLASGSLRLSASFGVASWPDPKVAACSELVAKADDALYVAKKTGRNRVILFGADKYAANRPENE